MEMESTKDLPRWSLGMYLGKKMKDKYYIFDTV